MTAFGDILSAMLDEPEGAPSGSPRPSDFDDQARLFECEIAAASLRVAPAEAQPAWAVALEVQLPCSADELRRAFRKRAFRTHPDREGGSHEAFLQTQALLDEALADLRSRDARRSEPSRRRYAAAPAPRGSRRSAGCVAYA